MIQLLEFHLIFPREQPKEYSEYLTGMDRTTLFKLAGHFSRTSLNQDYVFDNVKVLSDWFREENNTFANSVYQKIQKYESDKNVKICILNIYTSLLFFEQIVTSKIDSTPIPSKAEEEINLFKLYLLLNSTYTEKDKKVYESTYHFDPKCRLEVMYFSNSIFDTDLLNYIPRKIIISQFIKAYLLFEELSTNQEYSLLLENFCNYYNCTDWKHYLSKVLPLTFQTIKANQTGYLSIIVPRDKDFNDNVEFINNFSISTTKGIDDPIDFKTIRNTPIYELERGSYLVVSDLFLNEKLFKGLYFKLKELNEELPLQNRITDFKALWCDQISEKKIFCSILDKAFEGRYLKYNGTQIKSAGISGEPDYYIRDRNKVYIFESKDILIPADVKTSGDFKKLRLSFREKLYFAVDKKRKKIKPKAVLQIINVIDRLLSNQDFVKIDNELLDKTLIIYPILVLHDNLFNVAGLNKLINRWFQKELEKLSKKGLSIKKVRPLTIVDIDTLIYNKEAIKGFKGPFSYFIDDYHCNFIKINFTKVRTKEQRNDIIERSMMSFAKYFDSHQLNRKYWKIPDEFGDYGIDLINSKQ